MTNSFINQAVNNNQINMTKRIKYKYFNLIYLSFILVSMLGVGLFNYIIDPYGIFNQFYLTKLNDIKPKKDDNDRLFKAVDIINLRPTTVIIGSSRTKQGIRTDHAAFSGQQNVYNLALNGANIYELKRYLEHAIYNQQNLKTVMLGLDFFMFNRWSENQPGFVEYRLEKKQIAYQDIINVLFSIDALQSSQQTISQSIIENEEQSDNLRGFQIRKDADNGQTKWRFESSIELSYEFYEKYDLSQQNLDYFREIVSLCQNNNIELLLFISPSHATQWESIAALGKWETFEQWKRELVKITSLWDFSDYNNITSEPIKDVMENYADSSHYRENVGNLILNRIYNQNIDQIPDNFGILITEDNIESHLANIRQRRQVWQQNNPEEAELVTNIMRKARKSQQ